MTAPPSRVIDLRIDGQRTGPYWHTFVPGIRAGQAYGLRARGPSAPERGLRFDRRRHPARPVRPGRRRRPGVGLAGVPTAGPSMKSVVVDVAAYDWEGDRPLGATVAETRHLRGARQGLHRQPELGGRAARARNLRRVHRQDPAPRGARCHRGRAPAGLRVRRAGRTGRPAQLLGLPAGVVLRAPRRLHQPARARRARSTSSATWSRRSTGRASRSSSTSSTTTRPRAATAARRSASAASPTSSTTCSTATTVPVRRLQRRPATRSTPTSRSCAG